MLREPKELIVTVGTTAAASTEILVENYSTLSFQLPAGTGTTQITMYATLAGDTFGIARDEDEYDVVVNVAAGKPQPIKSSIHPYKKVKLVASAGTATSGVAVLLKS